MTMNNWRKLYSASVTVTFTAWGMIRHIKIVRCDGKVLTAYENPTKSKEIG